MIFQCDFGGHLGLHGEGQKGAKMALLLSLFFKPILEAFWTQLTPKTTSEEGQGDNRRTFIFIDRVDENEPQALSAHPENASKKCFQESSEKDTKMTSPGAPKMTQKWHQKWS